LHELGREQLKTTKELLDITTRHASGEEAVGSVFKQSSGKAATGSSWGASTVATNKGTKRGIKSNKRGPRRWPQQVTVTASCGEDNIGKDASDSDKELVAVTEGDFKHQVLLPVDHF
jgi:hypothetical protein